MALDMKCFSCGSVGGVHRSECEALRQFSALGGSRVSIKFQEPQTGTVSSVTTPQRPRDCGGHASGCDGCDAIRRAATRDEFAKAALQGFIASNRRFEAGSGGCALAAGFSYALADAMLAERDKAKP